MKTDNITTVATITGAINVGVETLNPYEVAVNNGYIGTFDEWIHDMASAWCDHINFYIDPNTGCLMGEYDIDKYTFSLDEKGHMVVELKEGD